ncbi:MAG: type IV toxin-antitoxin system AbiEi family antitoxin [Caulobacterales bacterium]|nr:type IV toxin-antitoxin system AbiEi family antitoxin [Caulobacterales bacterium]
MDSKLNQLQTLLPAGLLVDGAWLSHRGYYSSLVAKYVSSGWLEQPTRGAYRRAGTAPLGGEEAWASVVLSLQRLRPPLPVLGGRTALELLGFGHYLSPTGPYELHLYGRDVPPLWVRRLLGEPLVFHRARLFTDDPVAGSVARPERDGDHIRRLDRDGLLGLVSVSTAERAFLELLDEVPQAASFHEADKLVEGLTTLSPRRLSYLLASCRSVKVKRLALWFADRHQMPWASHLDRQAVDLGQGNRVLVPGGRLDRTYKITVPREMERV